MERREFVWRLSLGLAAFWAGGRLSWPGPSLAASQGLRLALLADAHLPDGDTRRAEAQALARAVAEIRRLSPAPDLVLLAGDLAHNGHTQALALGREILGDLPAPLMAVMGEGDNSRDGAGAWSRLFGAPRFSRPFPGFHLLGLHTSLSPSPQGPVFQVGREQRGWLARELARLDPNLPLIILSHAPLTRIFHPWQQWTGDAAEVLGLLAPFSRVLCVHGHVHQEAVSSQLSAFNYDLGRFDRLFPTEDHLRHQGLPATSWPLPSPLQGTLSAARPGVGPRGCGWGLLTLGEGSLQYQPQVWQA
jgi:Icc protein